MKRHKALVAIVAMVVALALAYGTVLAEDATITVTGGSLSETIQNVVMTGVTIDGTDQTSTGASASAWDAEDATGTGAGWHLTLVSSDFSGSGHSIAASGFEIQLANSDIAVVYGNTKPTSSVTSWTAINTEKTVVSAALDTGMGSYTLDPDFQLSVPAETYASSYTATITATIVSTP